MAMLLVVVAVVVVSLSLVLMTISVTMSRSMVQAPDTMVAGFHLHFSSPVRKVAILWATLRPAEQVSLRSGFH